MKHVSKEDHPIIGPMNGIDLWAYDAKTDGVVNYWFDSQSTEVLQHTVRRIRCGVRRPGTARINRAEGFRSSSVRRSSFVVYDAKAEQITDVTASAIGAVEYWDQTTPWDNEVLAFALRGKARFLIGDNPDQPVDFRKAYRVIGPAGYELAYYLSDDDGANWRKLFQEIAVRVSDETFPGCSDG